MEKSAERRWSQKICATLFALTIFRFVSLRLALPFCSFTFSMISGEKSTRLGFPFADPRAAVWPGIGKADCASDRNQLQGTERKTHTFEAGFFETRFDCVLALIEGKRFDFRAISDRLSIFDCLSPKSFISDSKIREISAQVGFANRFSAFDKCVDGNANGTCFERFLRSRNEDTRSKWEPFGVTNTDERDSISWQPCDRERAYGARRRCVRRLRRKSVVGKKRNAK